VIGALAGIENSNVLSTSSPSGLIRACAEISTKSVTSIHAALIAEILRDSAENC